MFLKHKPSGDLVEVLDLKQVYDPFSADVRGRLHVGEEMQEPGLFSKDDLVFPSGETLPLCWRDSRYREHLDR